jgi:pyruvate dehydrogenase E1 component alpha subunit
MSDPVSGTYRSKEEVDRRKELADPISLLRDRLFEAGLLTQAQLEALDAEVRTEVDEAGRYADESPPPEADQLYTQVYHEINAYGRLFLDGREG